ncbi:hypothetical protein ACOZ38_07300 [Sphaerisporangium viridialbum]|uniref:hypothetical protein n=1 Tax=Sphaerisporangium viridialbum TaxID=46189 RepID=UPI003C75D515
MAVTGFDESERQIWAGQAATSQTRAEIKRRFDLLSSEFADADGMLTLPHAALLARARR